MPSNMFVQLRAKQRILLMGSENNNMYITDTCTISTVTYTSVPNLSLHSLGQDTLCLQERAKFHHRHRNH
jgi:hypothetical protein